MHKDMYSNPNANRLLFPELQQTTERLVKSFDSISPARKELLRQMINFIDARVRINRDINLNFICTHNSRRSQVSQVWAQAAAHYYGVRNVYSFSGGTEATAFNLRAVNAIRDAGFMISTIKNGVNPVYEVFFAKDAKPITAFSKTYDDPFNVNTDFIAILTCSHADENCPLVPGAIQRVALTYDDPKEYDSTSREAEKYKERVEQIGTEILYAFSRVIRT